MIELDKWIVDNELVGLMDESLCMNKSTLKQSDFK